MTSPNFSQYYQVQPNELLAQAHSQIKLEYIKFLESEKIYIDYATAFQNIIIGDDENDGYYYYGQVDGQSGMPHGLGMMVRKD